MAKFAKGLSKAQRLAPGIRQQADRKYPLRTSSSSTADEHIEAEELGKVFLHIREQIRGPAPAEELICLVASNLAMGAAIRSSPP